MRSNEAAAWSRSRTGTERRPRPCARSKDLEGSGRRCVLRHGSSPQQRPPILLRLLPLTRPRPLLLTGRSPPAHTAGFSASQTRVYSVAAGPFSAQTPSPPPPGRPLRPAGTTGPTRTPSGGSQGSIPGGVLPGGLFQHTGAAEVRVQQSPHPALPVPRQTLLSPRPTPPFRDPPETLPRAPAEPPPLPLRCTTPSPAGPGRASAPCLGPPSLRHRRPPPLPLPASSPAARAAHARSPPRLPGPRSSPQ